MTGALDMMVETTVHRLRKPFVIARQRFTEARSIRVTLRSRGGLEGRGAAAGVDYEGESADSMRAQLEAVRARVEQEISRTDLLDLLPAGGARNALDAALWDLEAKSTGQGAFALAGLSPAPVQSTITLSLGTPEQMAAAASDARTVPWLKIKVGAVDPLAAIRAVRQASPRARLLVDANQAWTIAQLRELEPALEALGVAVIEQPLPVDADHALEGYAGSIPLCADESCRTEQDLPTVAQRYAMINIKLDKAGGLTAGLALADAAERLGLGVMVGCMLAPSLAIAPALVLAQRALLSDVDSPPFLAEDDHPAFTFRDGLVDQPHLPALWG